MNRLKEHDGQGAESLPIILLQNVFIIISILLQNVFIIISILLQNVYNFCEVELCSHARADMRAGTKVKLIL